MFPYAMIILAFEVFFAFTSETVSVQTWVRTYAEWDEPPHLKRRWFSQQNYLCHLGMIEKKAPKILAIGSSRVGDFATRMFWPVKDDFYTADGLIYRMDDLRKFTEAVLKGDLPSPDVLILGLDHWVLSPRPARSAWLESGPNDDVLTPSSHLAVICNLMRSPFEKGERFKYANAKAPDVPSLDVDALEPLKEYDASEFIDRENPPVIERVFSGGNRFEFIPDLDKGKIAELGALLKLLNEKGVEVAIFLPPFSSETYQAVSESSRHKQWWHTYSVTLPQFLRSEGYVCIGPSTPQDYDLTDKGNMRDGFHCGPYMMSYILEELVLETPQNSHLRRIDLNHLRSLRQASDVAGLPSGAIVSPSPAEQML